MRKSHVLIAYGVASLTAVALGCLVCAQSGVPVASWARNGAGLVVGASAALALARWAGPMVFRLAMIVAPLGLAASLFSPGQQGVHRWIDVGPAVFNIAFVLTPMAVVALAVQSERRWPWAAAFLALAVLVLQPDASQATALALAMALLIWRTRADVRLKGGGAVLMAALIWAAWLRPDPLAPVAEVEGVIGLAWDLTPALAVAAVASLAVAVLSPALVARNRLEVATPALALALYLAVTTLAPLLGAFPVPLVGLGMSPILGFWLGIGLLAAAWRVSRPDVSASPVSGS